MKKLAILALMIFLCALPLVEARTIASPAIHGSDAVLPVEKSSTRDPDLDYYRVVDVYPSGRKVIRGKASFGEKIDRKIGIMGHPLSRDVMWFRGHLLAYLYFPDVFGSSSKLYNISSGELIEAQTWSHNLGDQGYVAIIDYGFDGYEDFVLPGSDNRPVVVNGTDGSIICSISMGSDAGIYDVATGNLDDDPAEEVVMLADDGSLLIVDDWSTGFNLIKKIYFKDIVPESFLTDADTVILLDTSSDVYLYDVDLDKVDEILLSVVAEKEKTIISIKWWYEAIGIIIDDAQGNFEKKAEIMANDPVESFINDSWIAAGDFDGNGYIEIVLGLNRAAYARYNVSTGIVERLGDLYYPLVVGDTTEYQQFEASKRSYVVYDIDYDYKDEIVLLGVVHDYDTGNLMVKLQIMNFNTTGITGIYTMTNFFGGHAPSSPSTVELALAVGDFDGDFFAEVLAVAEISDWSEYDLYAFDDIKRSYAQITHQQGSITKFGSKPILSPISPNVRILIRYTGIHNVSISQPYLIAALAAPPTIEGIQQNYDDTATMFGTAVSKTTEVENGYTISTGVTLSFEYGDIFNIISVEASMTFSMEFERTRTVSRTITECREFIGDYQNNYIIFETVLYDNFYYEVLLHPNKSLVGSIMAISVPSTPTMYKWTVDYFNSHNGDNPDIGSETFQHTIGEAWTYLTPADALDLEQKYRSSGFWKTSTVMSVGSGKGVNAIEIDLENEETTSEKLTFGVEFEAGVTIAGVGLSVSVGLGTSYMYSVSVGRATKYRGDIGDIDPNFYDVYKYSVGMLVYNFYRESAKVAYQVINYWVTDYWGPTTKEDEITTSLVNNPMVGKVAVQLSKVTGLPIGKAAIVIVAVAGLGIVITPFILIKVLKRRGKKKRGVRKRK